MAMLAGAAREWDKLRTVDRPYSLGELREGISHLGEWDEHAHKVTVLVADTSKASRGTKDDLATLPLRPVVFVHQGEDLVFEGECVIDRETLDAPWKSVAGEAPEELEALAGHVGGWIGRSSVAPNTTITATATLVPPTKDGAPLLARVKVSLSRQRG